MKHIALLVFAVTLSGCFGGGGHPLDPYVVEAGEAPDACYYADLTSEEWEIVQLVGLTENPGSISAEVMEDAPVIPVDNRVAIFECRFAEGTFAFVSGAAEFESKDEVDRWLQEADDQALFETACTDQVVVFRTDTVVGSIVSMDEDWHPAIADARDKALDRIIGDGAQSLC